MESEANPLTRTRIPTIDETGTSSTAIPWLYSAILGNGRLLVCLDEAGSIAQLFYPHIDAGPHVRTFLAGILVREVAPPNDLSIEADSTHPQGHSALAPENVGTRFSASVGAESESRVSWFASKEWTHELRYRDGAVAVQCVSVNASLGIQIEQTMAVHFEQDLLMNDIKVTNLGNSPITCNFVIYAGLDIDHRRSGMTSYFNVETSLLTFFSFDRYISFSCDAPVHDFGCDKASLGELDSVFQNATLGKFTGREYAIGQVSGAVSYDFGRIDPRGNVAHCMHMRCGKSLAEVEALASPIPRPDIEGTVVWWRNHYADARLRIGSPAVRTVYEHSLITLRLLTDSTTGGIIAAPECDPDFRSCGGYGLCWPRDGAFIVHALDSVGQYDHARMFYDWALRVQEESGVWYQRYYVNGQLAPVWGLVQFDETGAVVWAMCRHIQMTEDISYGRKAFPQLVRACKYMQDALDPETGLAPMTKDLWEERDGISTYACASTWGAFSELAKLAVKLGESVEAEHWHSAAIQLKTAIETHLWDASHGRFLRGMRTKIQAHDVARLRKEPGFSEADIVETEFAGKPRYFRYKDPIIDTSILGLSTPFGVFSPDDPRMQATVKAIFAHLTSPVGGIRRYEDDNYRGGNPWVICTLWLALQDLAAGQKERALHLYNWAVEHRTSLDLLPEQIDQTTGKPCWVIPLAWSHAMFLLATEECRKQGLL